MERKRKKLYISCLVALLFLFFGIVIYKDDIHRKNIRNNYVKVENFLGAEFYVPQKLNEVSTVVLEVLPEVDFQLGEVYKYQNGKDYLLFEPQQFLIVAQYNTKFQLGDLPVEESLEKKSLSGIRFETIGKKKNMVKQEGVYVYEVASDVNVAGTDCGRYKGKLKVIGKNGVEVSLFVGQADEKDEDLFELLEPVICSFSLTEKKNLISTYEVDMETGIFTPTHTESEWSSNIYCNEYEKASNQEKIEKKETCAYTSNIYSLLDINDIGVLFLYGEEHYNSIFEVFVKVNKVLDAEETETMIQEYIESGEAYYSEMEVPEGCHLEAIEYQVTYPLGIDYPYVNITLCGLDGEQLRHGKNKFEQRTYDILYKEEMVNEWFTKRYCYYVVPNGCKEYVLKFGNHINDEDACYRLDSAEIRKQNFSIKR